MTRERNENGEFGFNSERAACERYPLRRVPDDNSGEWWLDARATGRILVDGYRLVEPGDPVDVKSTAWRIQGARGPRRGRWMLRRDSHEMLREADGWYVLMVASDDDSEIVACILRPAEWVEGRVTTWSPSKVRGSSREVAQVPWSRVFEEHSEGVVKPISGLASGGASA